MGIFKKDNKVRNCDFNEDGKYVCEVDKVFPEGVEKETVVEGQFDVNCEPHHHNVWDKDPSGENLNMIEKHIKDAKNKCIAQKKNLPADY